MPLAFVSFVYCCPRAAFVASTLATTSANNTTIILHCLGYLGHSGTGVEDGSHYKCIELLMCLTLRVDGGGESEARGWRSKEKVGIYVQLWVLIDIFEQLASRSPQPATSCNACRQPCHSFTIYCRIYLVVFDCL